MPEFIADNSRKWRSTWDLGYVWTMVKVFFPAHTVKRHYARNPSGLRNHYVAFLQNMHAMG